MGHEDGSATIVSKFTMNGSRLYMVTAEREGQLLPDPPAVSKLYDDLEKTRLEQILLGTDFNPSSDSPADGIRPTDTDADEESVAAEGGSISSIEAIKQSVVFRTDSANKFDRYKMHKVGTIGAHVSYKEFSESSLRVRDRSVAGANSAITAFSSSLQHAESTDACTAETSTPSRSMGDIKTDLSAVVPNVNITTSLGRKRPLPVEEVMVAGREVSFGLSALLPLPVRVSLIGVQKFRVNCDNMVTKIEWLAAYR
jgi:hypothetical protein